ncbi:Zn(2)-C6 fungal-type DNA-binding domain protein [Metarhizium guizhouense ARSEF 977]|uniref:Zn(2)-C6 fungal-type DNA-binding domain protein n=1 Tax=Metarhizium guizhouense (strain ARSEF 977) TaxID=1276136 RepID=A0A0B4GZZ7_METGA|nr:Zn(2)-C6 fungal-type DNA-binding domain protein [Metarhizium guizhouense ARSEF 977]
MVKPDPDARPEASAPVRQRKWHSRVFTGCINCRRRHVKCDEGAPSCSNCTRLNLPCNFDRKFVFKAARHAGPPGPKADKRAKVAAASSEPRASSRSDSASSGEDGSDETSAQESSSIDGVAVTSTMSPTGSKTPPSSLSFISEDFACNYKHARFPVKGQYMASPVYWCEATDVPRQIDFNDNFYLRHFLETVSSYLIIYDTPANSNPYRQLPSLMSNSGLLRDVMKAFGAMHIAGLPETRNRQVHHSAAVKAYGNVVTQLRDTVAFNQGHPTLELLATTLLLCMFEKISSNDASWRIHLAGAAQIFQSLYSPRVGPPSSPTAKSSGMELSSVSHTLPLRRFLVSLMAYLDVAASLATGDGPLIQGDYWETFGGGWEYNMGVPSFATVRSSTDRTMAQIRQSWSRIMSIQTDISKFVKMEKEGLAQHQKDMYYNDLSYRLRNWQESAPDIYLRLHQLDSMPADATPEEFETLTAASCIQIYSLSCVVHLETVKARRIGNAATDPTVAAAVSRILTLILGFQSGINQLAVLWPLLTAGIATVDPGQQQSIRERLAAMRGFGFKVGASSSPVSPIPSTNGVVSV